MSVDRKCVWRSSGALKPLREGLRRGFELTRAAEGSIASRVTGRYIPPPPGVFRKDINPWELLTNFSQGYHSKRLLDAPVVFPATLMSACFFVLRQVTTARWAKRRARQAFPLHSDTLFYFTGRCKASRTNTVAGPVGSTSGDE